MEFYLRFQDIWDRSPSALSLFFVPAFLLAIAVEAYFVIRREGSYPWQSAGVSVLITIGHFVTQAATNGLLFGIIAFGVYQFRLTTIPVSFANWPSVVLLFVLVDLAFYIEHRCSHRISFLWASHSVHHSTERMIMPAAFRLTWTPIVSGVFAFYLPIVWLGYDPVWVYGMASASLTYQFFVHTEFVPRIGWLEWFINTPSAHRVHHASNPEYLDRNFGGVLMIWDHLFGTYQGERPELVTRFGLLHPRSSPINPFVIAYEGFLNLWRQLRRIATWRGRFAVIAGPP
jgi:sterol desaturase/sphingolipid hydroxylase (fatty acid hydroxylase superfamily)